MPFFYLLLLFPVLILARRLAGCALTLPKNRNPDAGFDLITS